MSMEDLKNLSEVEKEVLIYKRISKGRRDQVKRFIQDVESLNQSYFDSQIDEYEYLVHLLNLTKKNLIVKIVNHIIKTLRYKEETEL